MYSLTGQLIKDTFGRVVQIINGVFYDGYGNPIVVLPTENKLTVSSSITLDTNITYVEIITANTSVTLPSANNNGKQYSIANVSSGEVSIIASGSNRIGNTPDTLDSVVTIYSGDAPRIISSDTNWRFI